MNITKEIKKQKAIELMNKLDIYKPYIKGFKDKNSVCFYENFGGFWAYQEPVFRLDRLVLLSIFCVFLGYILLYLRLSHRLTYRIYIDCFQ